LNASLIALTLLVVPDVVGEDNLLGAAGNDV
jgi:hypothetical protein